MAGASFENSMSTFQLAISVFAIAMVAVESFSPSHTKFLQCRSSKPWNGRGRNCHGRVSRLQYSISGGLNDRNDDDDDDDDDDLIDPDTLGDWRTFRRNLASTTTITTTTSSSSTSSSSSSSLTPGPEFVEDDSDLFQQVSSSSSSSPSSSKASSSVATESSQRPKSVSKDNEELLLSQNEELAKEYMSGVWAHETFTPEVGGLLVRMPLEVELHRNYKHSLLGQKLKRIVGDDEAEISTWFAKAQKLVADEMKTIAEAADEQGQIDINVLAEESKEMLTLYLDNQETWQEVCLVLEQGSSGQAKAVVLNRPMAMKLTPNLGKMLLFGAFPATSASSSSSLINRAKCDDEDLTFVDRKRIMNFLYAFSNECAVYVGGPDDQEEPAIMVHGIRDLPGAKEISPGSNIYCGGVDAAAQGVLDGTYNPLEFRFFVGCHSYEEHGIELGVHLGKYQPVAAARSVALKQCMSLPKPLWHEVLELCGGDMEDISSVERLKRDDLQFQVIEDVEELFGDDDDADDDDDEIPDELGELENFDDDDEEYY